MITRLADEVSIRLMPPGGSAFVSALIDGECLSAAAIAGLSADPEFDLSMAIGEIISAGAFSHIETENSDVEHDKRHRVEQ